MDCTARATEFELQELQLDLSHNCSSASHQGNTWAGSQTTSTIHPLGGAGTPSLATCTAELV